jgi:hypothetical protein
MGDAKERVERLEEDARRFTALAWNVSAGARQLGFIILDGDVLDVFGLYDSSRSNRIVLVQDDVFTEQGGARE